MDFLTEQHVLAFGAIIHRYAHCESGLRMALSPLLGIDRIDVMILTEPLNSLGLRNVAKSLVKSREPLSEASQRLLAVIDEFEKFGSVRNCIAHDRWMRGGRQNSIKPARIDIRGGNVRVSGIFDQKADYTPNDLFDAANALGELGSGPVKPLAQAVIG